MIDRALSLDHVLATARTVIDHSDASSPEARIGRAELIDSLHRPATTTALTPAENQKVFIPRDVALALLQAGTEERLATTHPEHPDPKQPLDAALASETMPGVAGLGVKFSTEDLVGWGGTFLISLAKYLERRRTFTAPTTPPARCDLALTARVVVVGDWGTGEGAADKVAEQIRVELADAQRANREAHVIHLGDVYYAGTKWEAQTRFLDHWPVHPQEHDKYHSWCLNGNHDMYSAGEGLFDVILNDDRFATQRTVDGKPTSRLYLANDHWDLFGLDTSAAFDALDPAGEVGHLPALQVQWVENEVSAHPERGRILLSHHQPFTRDGNGLAPVGELLEMTRALREQGGLDTWLWGHEHRLFTYGARDGIGYAVCTGHGAIPTPEGPSVAQPGEWEFQGTFTDPDGQKWRLSGFTVLDFDHDQIQVRYVDENGVCCRGPEAIQRTSLRWTGETPASPVPGARPLSGLRRLVGAVRQFLRHLLGQSSHP